MHTATSPLLRPRLLLSLGGALFAASLLPAQFIPSSGDYNNSANWTGGVINGQFQFSGTQSASFATNTTLGTNLSWHYTGTGSGGASFGVSGASDRTLTINSPSISVTSAFTSYPLNVSLSTGLSGGPYLNVNLAGTTAINVGTNSSLALNRTTISGNVTKTGSGALVATNLNVTGSLTVSAGEFSNFGTLTGNVSTGSGAQVGFSDTTTYAGVISGASSLTSGNGLNTALTLTGANTYTGSTTIHSGTLLVAGANALPTTTNVTINSGANLTLNWAQTIGSLSGSGGVNLAFGTLTTSSSANSTFSGVLSGSRSFTKSGTGTLTLNGANTYAGSTSVNGGTLVAAAANVLPSTTILQLVSTGTLRMSHDQAVRALTGGSGSATSSLILENNATLTIVDLGGDYRGVISGSGNLVRSAGTTATTLSGANTYAGSTAINAGLLVALNTAGSATGTGPVTINNAGLRGTGTITGDVTLNAGGYVTGGGGTGSQGLGPAATLYLGNLEMNPSSALRVGLADAAGSAGATAGWSFLSLSGGLDLNGSAGSPLTLQLASIDASGQSAAALNFDPGTNATFLVASAAGGITGFAANAWTVDTSAFQNAFTGAFSLSQTGNNLYLNYAAIPEPSTYAALAGVLALGLAAWHRRRQVS